MAKRITDEDLRLNLIVNGDKARKELLETEKRIAYLQAEVNRAEASVNIARNRLDKGSTSAYLEAAAALKKYRDELQQAKDKFKELQLAVPLTSKTIVELKKQIVVTRTALERAVPGTENWNRLNTELQQVKARLVSCNI